MRPRAQLSAAGVVIVVLIAVLGFAAVSTKGPTPETEATTTEYAPPASLSARVAAAAFSTSLNPEVGQAPAPTTASTTAPVAASPRVEPGTDTSTTTTSAPATTTTTTTTAPPPTTTTTEPPPTTTTAPPVAGGARDVEEWRSLVAQYFPAEIVDGALVVIACESNGDPLAENPYSGAAGLFQFIPSTWAWAAPSAGFGGASPFDPAANVGTAAWVVQRSVDRGNHPWDHWSCRP